MDEIANTVCKLIAEARIVPVLRMDNPSAAVNAANRLIDGGVGLVEIAATTPRWYEALETLATNHTDITFGVGTIVTAEEASRALAIGASFLVCPWISSEVRQAAGGYLIEGGFTPGELAAAATHGLAKLFPSHVVGPDYLRSVLAVLPGAQIMPTGGLTLETAPAWLEAGAVAVGVGASLADHPNAGKAIAEVIERVAVG